MPDAAPSAIGATLASRLQGLGDLGSLADQHLAQLPRPFLRGHWPLPDVTSMNDEGHTGPIGDCALSPWQPVGTTSDDRLVILWDFPSLTVRRVLRGIGSGLGLVCFPRTVRGSCRPQWMDPSESGMSKMAVYSKRWAT